MVYRWLWPSVFDPAFYPVFSSGNLTQHWVEVHLGFDQLKQFSHRRLDSVRGSVNSSYMALTQCFIQPFIQCFSLYIWPNSGLKWTLAWAKLSNFLIGNWLQGEFLWMEHRWLWSSVFIQCFHQYNWPYTMQNFGLGQVEQFSNWRLASGRCSVNNA